MSLTTNDMSAADIAAVCGNNRGGSDGYRRGYSRDEGKENARMQLQELMGMATDPNVRMAIQKAMDEMEKE